MTTPPLLEVTVKGSGNKTVILQRDGKVLVMHNGTPYPEPEPPYGGCILLLAYEVDRLRKQMAEQTICTLVRGLTVNDYERGSDAAKSAMNQWLDSIGLSLSEHRIYETRITDSGYEVLEYEKMKEGGLRFRNGEPMTITHKISSDVAPPPFGLFFKHHDELKSYA